MPQSLPPTTYLSALLEPLITSLFEVVGSLCTGLYSHGFDLRAKPPRTRIIKHGLGTKEILQQKSGHSVLRNNVQKAGDWQVEYHQRKTRKCKR